MILVTLLFCLCPTWMSNKPTSGATLWCRPLASSEKLDCTGKTSLRETLLKHFSTSVEEKLFYMIRHLWLIFKDNDVRTDY
jgi:hypothetical protein